jgi:hypothetical protein
MDKSILWNFKRCLQASAKTVEFWYEFCSRDSAIEFTIEALLAMSDD